MNAAQDYAFDLMIDEPVQFKPFSSYPLNLTGTQHAISH